MKTIFIITVFALITTNIFSQGDTTNTFPGEKETYRFSDSKPDQEEQPGSDIEDTIEQMEEKTETYMTVEEESNFQESTETYKMKDNDDGFKTLIGESEIGGYGAFSVCYTEIDNRSAISIGGRGAVILGHSFALGFAGSGFINEVSYNAADNEDYSLAGGYGGLFFEPIILPKYPVHISIPVVVGVGGVAYAIMDDNYDHEYNYVDDSDVFLVIEPGIEMEFNFTRYFRFALTGTYRFTSNIEVRNTDKDALTGYNIGVTFKFGKF